MFLFYVFNYLIWNGYSYFLFILKWVGDFLYFKISVKGVRVDQDRFYSIGATELPHFSFVSVVRAEY